MENDNIIQNQESKELTNLNPKNLTISIRDVNTESIEYFTKDEINLLLSKVPPERVMIFQTLWRTGIRVTELINIRKCDIEFLNNEITIRWLKKRKIQYRKIPLHNSLKNPLYLYSANLKSEDKLFNMSRQRVDQLCKKFNFGHAHKFRHSYAINFLRQSKSSMALMELKNLLGHTHINTTMEYLKVVPIQLKKSVENIVFD